MNDQLYRVRFFHEEHAPWADPRDDHNYGTMVCWHSRYTLGDEQPKGSSSPEEFWPDRLIGIIPAKSRKEWLASRPEMRLLVWLYDCVHWDYVDPVADWDSVKEVVREEISNVRLRWDGDRSAASEAWDAYRTLQKVRKKHYNASEWISSLVDEYFCVLDLYLYDHSGITMSTGPFSCPWDSGQVGFIYAPWDPEAPSGKNDEPHGITDPDVLKAALEQEVETYNLFLTGQVYGYEIEKGKRVTIRTSKTYADGTVKETCHDIIEWEHWDGCGGYVADYSELPAIVLHSVPKELQELFKPMLDSALERLDFPSGEWAYSPAAASEGDH
jgi:hypothetical protein